MFIWRNHFSHLLNIQGVNDDWQTVIQTAEPRVPEPIAFKAELAIGKQKRHKSLGINHIPAELIKAGGQTHRSEIHKFINSI